MSPMHPCLEPGCHVLTRGGPRCATHTRVVDRARGTRQERGYGAAHEGARRTLGGMLPYPCGYCHVVVGAGERWVAAHLVDGSPEYGWMVAHPACNELAKRSHAGHRGDGGAARTAPPTSGPALSGVITHSRVPLVDV